MKIIREPAEMRDFRLSLQSEKVGFVPTMGSLHKGHLNLVEQAKKACASVVVSIYVNPLQFGQNEDFKTYPRDLDRDFQVLRELSIDAVFTPPSLEENGTATKIDNPELGNLWCGAKRPGHFSGVLAVVSKLHYLVQPSDMWFGQKDYQQAQIIKCWAKEFYISTKIHIHPIVRDFDDLALSSRNQYLSKNQRQNALKIPQSLKLAQQSFQKGENESKKLINIIRQVVKEGIELEYVGIVNPQTLGPVEKATSGSVILIAAKCGSTRLIDNMIL